MLEEDKKELDLRQVGETGMQTSAVKHCRAHLARALAKEGRGCLLGGSTALVRLGDRWDG
jgi:hypothetical protein